jgi:hypothetical protein
MKRIYFFVSFALIAINLSAQMSIEEINYRLDTRPYFNLGLPYDTIISLPDSIQEKFARSLNREVSEQVLDSLVSPTDQQKERLLQNLKQECKEDTLCIQQRYQSYIKERKENHREMYANDIMPTKMILRAANWNVKKAIPVLEKSIGNEKYNQHSVLMALAKLGNDSIKQVLMERYTLSYLLQNTQLDTISDETPIYGLKWAWSTRGGIETAMYLKNKEMLLNIIDLIYIRGISRFSIGLDDFYSPNVSFFVDAFDDYNYFHNFPNYEALSTICNDYSSAIWRLSDRKLNKKEKQELQTLLSTEYRSKIREQLREWIIENVNFK